VPASVSDSGQHTRKRGGVAAQSIRNHGMRDGVRPMNQMAKEPLRRRAIAPFLNQDVDNPTVLINGSPQLMNPSLDSNEYFVHMPAPAHSTSVLPQPSGVLRSEFAAPQPDRLIADDYASRGQQFFDVPERQREPIIDPHRMGDDLRWESVALIGGDGHRSSIGQTAGLTCQYPCCRTVLQNKLGRQQLCAIPRPGVGL
jgi:hypothetical protein